MDSVYVPTFEAAFAPTFETATVPAAPALGLRLPGRVDPLTIGLSMVNWLVLMLLMSGFMLATTMANRAEPAGHAEVGTAATH
jgi:hypothetical protein